MKYIVSDAFVQICNQIVDEKKDIEGWSKIESDDMFNLENYRGGFDATENEFCFSVFLNEDEFWFQVSLDEVGKITKGINNEVEIRKAE